MTDFDGQIAYANPTLARLFGEERPEDMIGQNIAAYYNEEYLRRRKDVLIPTLLQEGRWNSETSIFSRGGKPIQISQSTFLSGTRMEIPFGLRL